MLRDLTVNETCSPPVSGRLTLDELRNWIQAGRIDTVIVAFPDMQGRLIGKRITGSFFLNGAHQETHACDYLLTTDMEMDPVPGYAAASWSLGYGDLVLKPDLGTLRRVPWLEGTAQVLADVTDHSGSLLAHAPRTILKQQLARLAERGWTATFASELEFYLFDQSYAEARGQGYRELRPAAWYIEDYHIFQGTKVEGLIRAIRNGMEQGGIPIEGSKGEWGPGQQEINLCCAEALEMADRHVLYKSGAKEIAHQQGKAITFMAKWSSALAGSSCHVHCSLQERATGRALFDDGESTDGMSDLLRQFMAGQLALAAESTVFLAPYVNSYKRFQAQSFAPTRLAWSWDNRTTGFRVVGRGHSLRLESRIPGADCNPYLAYAAMIAAGLHGIDQRLPLEPACAGNAYESSGVERVPGNLRDAIERLERSQPLRQALGHGVVEHYLHAARHEQADYDRAVTDYELRRMFERC
jgi:glutamine synthetase